MLTILKDHFRNLDSKAQVALNNMFVIDTTKSIEIECKKCIAVKNLVYIFAKQI